MFRERPPRRWSSSCVQTVPIMSRLPLRFLPMDGENGPVTTIVLRSGITFGERTRVPHRARLVTTVATAEHTRARGTTRGPSIAAAAAAGAPQNGTASGRAIERNGAPYAQTVYAIIIYAPRSPPQRERLRKRRGPRLMGPVCVRRAHLAPSKNGIYLHATRQRKTARG